MASPSSQFADFGFGEIVFGNTGTFVVKAWGEICPAKDSWGDQPVSGNSFSAKPVASGVWTKHSPDAISITQCEE